jgi:hypothetical protein
VNYRTLGRTGLEVSEVGYGAWGIAGDAWRDEVPSTVDLSVGEDFSGRSGGYTHAHFARFEDTAGLREYMEHLAVVEKLDATTTGRIVADYEF